MVKCSSCCCHNGLVDALCEGVFLGLVWCVLAVPNAVFVVESVHLITLKFFGVVLMKYHRRFTVLGCDERNSQKGGVFDQTAVGNEE